MRAFILSLAAGLLFVLACAESTESPNIKQYPTSTPDPSYYASDTNIVHVTRIIDGDTVEVRFESGESDRVRIIGVDTPEIFSPNQASEYGNITDLDCLDKWGDVYPEGCLESEFHFPVDCDSELAAFEIVNSVEVINASHYPYKSDWQKYAERCPDESDSFSYPSLSEWKMGDNQLLCLTSINLKNGYEESHHHD